MQATPDQIQPVEGQLNTQERELLTRAILEAPQHPQVAVEVGTWLGGGSTLHILRALERNGCGHLWGIEADRQVYDRMLANLKAAAPQTLHRFTPLFGLSEDVIPRWLAEQPAGFEIDFAFLDGGNNPLEQITEFRLLEPRIPVGGQLMAHDAKMRKAKWLIPYMSLLDNWQTGIHDVSREGLFSARKIGSQPSRESLQGARRRLFRARLQPTEIAAAILPARVCLMICRMLPARAFARLFAGAKVQNEKV
jgi:predicted O-methyltransferase YrrM